MQEWLSTDEAVKYVGLGRTKLLELLKKGRIPGNKVNGQWRIKKTELDLWVMQSRDFTNFFTSLSPEISENFYLRDPQKEAYKALYDFFTKGGRHAIVQLPVGCGKSGVAALAPLGIAKGRVLVVTPNVTIRKEMKDTLDITNKQKCFWLTRNVLKEEAVLAGPYVCSLDEANLSVAKESHIVVTNVQQLSTNVEKWLDQLPADFFDMIIVDEAHHSPAKSWQMVLDKFDQAKVLYLTATPFRSDRQEIPGELVYRYSFRSATTKGYIKRLTASYVAPDEMEVSFRNKEGTEKYTLEEVMKMKEHDWFSKDIALSPECNLSIVENSLKRLEELRLTGTKHQLIAVACSIHHAKQVCGLYEERGYHSAVIHSKMTDEEQDEVFALLKNNSLDCVIQVQMLGEGFDHPKLSVSAIFRPFRSLSPYIQFVGRIMRVIAQSNPGNPDNYGHIVTHIGMNVDKLAKEFLQFENDDKDFWTRVVGGEEPEPPSDVKRGEGKQRLVGGVMKVEGQVIQSLFEQDFLDEADEAILEHLRQEVIRLGLDGSLANRIIEEELKKRSHSDMSVVEAAKAFPVQPEKAREVARDMLREEEKQAAKALLNRLGFKPVGRELTKLGIANAQNNFVSAMVMVSQKIRQHTGLQARSELSTDELKKLRSEALPEILDQLTREIHAKQK